MGMSTISILIGLILLGFTFKGIFEALRPSRRNPNCIDEKMYED